MCEASVVVTVSAPSFSKKAARILLAICCFVLVFYTPYFIISRKDRCSILVPVNSDGFRSCINLEVANTEASRIKGLSGRESMPKYSGLLFVFDNEGRQCMWMKGMSLSLDIVWADQRGDITHVEKGLNPETYPKVFCGGMRDKYVIELNAGIASEANLVVGKNLRLK